jgi:hypothetical protein
MKRRTSRRTTLLSQEATKDSREPADPPIASPCISPPIG